MHEINELAPECLDLVSGGAGPTIDPDGSGTCIDPLGRGFSIDPNGNG